ncbi:hypothetical protein JCM11641_001382 [Rhodosporidiobolus odoratus]
MANKKKQAVAQRRVNAAAAACSTGNDEVDPSVPVAEDLGTPNRKPKSQIQIPPTGKALGDDLEAAGGLSDDFLITYLNARQSYLRRIENFARKVLETPSAMLVLEHWRRSMGRNEPNSIRERERVVLLVPDLTLEYIAKGEGFADLLACLFNAGLGQLRGDKNFHEALISPAFDTIFEPCYRSPSSVLLKVGLHFASECQTKVYKKHRKICGRYLVDVLTTPVFPSAVNRPPPFGAAVQLTRRVFSHVYQISGHHTSPTRELWTLNPEFGDLEARKARHAAFHHTLEDLVKKAARVKIEPTNTQLGLTAMWAVWEMEDQTGMGDWGVQRNMQLEDLMLQFAVDLNFDPPRALWDAITPIEKTTRESLQQKFSEASAS